MDTSDLQKGLKLLFSDQPYIVVECHAVRPSHGQPFMRAKLRNLVTSSMLEHTFKAGEHIELADVEERQLQYRNPDGSSFVFMDDATGEQLTVPGDKLGDHARWLSDGMKVEVIFFHGQPIGVSLPAQVVLQVSRTEPAAKNDVHASVAKHAILSTGATVNVPLDVKEGEWVKIDTRYGLYIERATHQ